MLSLPVQVDLPDWLCSGAWIFSAGACCAKLLGCTSVWLAPKMVQKQASRLILRNGFETANVTETGS